MMSSGLYVWLGRKIAINGIRKKLCDNGAISRKTRILPEEAGITSKRELGWIDYLEKQGKIGKTKDGKIWWKE